MCKNYHPNLFISELPLNLRVSTFPTLDLLYRCICSTLLFRLMAVRLYVVRGIIVVSE